MTLLAGCEGWRVTLLAGCEAAETTDDTNSDLLLNANVYGAVVDCSASGCSAMSG